jgi:hypothetical protein
MKDSANILETMNNIQTWRQGIFINKPHYSHMGVQWKDQMRKEEAHKVRPEREGNAVCWCPDPDQAAWIAQRLNLAAKLEKMALDYAAGRTDGSEIITHVRDAVA